LKLSTTASGECPRATRWEDQDSRAVDALSANQVDLLPSPHDLSGSHDRLGPARRIYVERVHTATRSRGAVRSRQRLPTRRASGAWSCVGGCGDPTSLSAGPVLTSRRLTIRERLTSRTATACEPGASSSPGSPRSRVRRARGRPPSPESGSAPRRGRSAPRAARGPRPGRSGCHSRR
jgi:hypothetical protein